MNTFCLTFFVFYLSNLAFGKQYSRRQATPPPPIGKAPPAGKVAAKDINLTVLNFALTIENLEAQFYQDALAVFTPQIMQQAGLSPVQASAIRQQIQRQLIDEQSHIQAIQTAIRTEGGIPFAGCQFNFRSVLTDPITFISSARSIEAAGASAYMGAVSMITNGGVLGLVSSILPMEARHSSIVNVFSGGSAAPQPFDIPLSPPQVLAILGSLLQNCRASDLGLTANQPLSVIDGVTQSTLFSPGSILQFQTSALIQNLQTNTLSCQLLTGGVTTALVMPASSCIIPAQTVGGIVNGPVMVFLTSNATPLTTNLTAQAPNIVAGPAVIFVDSNEQDFFGQLFMVKSLNIRTLPTANIASAALAPQPPRAPMGAPAAPAALPQAGAQLAQVANNGKAGKFRRRLIGRQYPAELWTGMKNLGLNSALMDVSWGAVPKSTIQNPSQVVLELNAPETKFDGEIPLASSQAQSWRLRAGRESY